MKDNDQTVNLGALIDAGVRSFKIEGRYKDMSYVKNITAHYRQMLDAIIDDRGDLARLRRAYRAFLYSVYGQNLPPRQHGLFRECP